MHIYSYSAGCISSLHTLMHECATNVDNCDVNSVCVNSWGSVASVIKTH